MGSVIHHPYKFFPTDCFECWSILQDRGDAQLKEFPISVFAIDVVTKHAVPKLSERRQAISLPYAINWRSRLLHPAVSRRRF